MAESTPLFVAHKADFEVLNGYWRQAHDGHPQVVHLIAPIGGGKRAMVGELCRQAATEDEDAILWRPNLVDEEDGEQVLTRLYGHLCAALHRKPVLRGKVEMTLNSQLPSQPPRVQRWYQSFIEGLKKGAPKPGEDKFQVSLPRDNPLLGLIEIVTGISRGFPIIFDLQNAHNTHSLAIAAFLEGLIRELSGQEESYFLAIINTVPLDDTAKAWVSLPLQDALSRCEDKLNTLTLQPWGAEEVGLYLESKGLTADAARLAEIGGGRPGYIAELVDWLESNDRLGDTASLTVQDIADVTPDEDDLEEDEDAEEGGEAADGRPRRRHATAEDADLIAYIASLLGLSFPSNLVADMGGFTRDSVDDILDATDGIYKELQFSKPLDSWIYQFHKELFRDSVLSRHKSERDQNIAQRVALFMEQILVPRGYGYLVKTMRLYAQNNAPQRAARLRSLALSSDKPQVWAMTHDLLRYFDEVEWPPAMRQTAYMNLLERMVNGGDVNQTEQLYNEASKWAMENERRDMSAWLLLAGSRLDYRRKDLYRARDRANDALKMYEALNQSVQQAEVQIHMGMIELSDGNPNAARDCAAKAIELANIPPIQANAHFIRGQVAKLARKFPEAVEEFTRANELAGKAGQAPLALEAGLNLGETLLVSGQSTRAADALTRVAQIAQSLRNPVGERRATAMLAQARVALKQYEGAIQAGQRTLQLTQALKFTRMEGIDIYNLGLFNLMQGNATEAISLFRQAREKADVTNVDFMKELLFNFGQALLQVGERTAAETTLKEALPLAQQRKDWRKVTAAHRTLAGLCASNGDKQGAQRHLQSALRSADQGKLKEEHKAIRRAINELK